MALYVLNTPVLTDYGVYEFKRISVEDTKKLLLKNRFVSAVGHEATARFLSKIIGIEIPPARIEIKMNVGDKAIVFRVLNRLPEGKILSEKEIEEIPYDVGLLERIN